MKTLPAYRVTLSNGSSYVTSMAREVTLDDARAYFVGQRFVRQDETTFDTVTAVDPVTE